MRSTFCFCTVDGFYLGPVTKLRPPFYLLLLHRRYVFFTHIDRYSPLDPPSPDGVANFFMTSFVFTRLELPRGRHVALDELAYLLL